MSICTRDTTFDRSILQLSNVVRRVMPSTDRKLELKAKASMAQPFSQPAVYANGLTQSYPPHSVPDTPPHIPVYYYYCYAS
jgi:hypothetical protein